MAVLGHGVCESCGRICYERGVLMIEAARVSDDTPPVQAFLEWLLREHPNDLADVLMRFEELARTGQLTIPYEMRALIDGIWEIKTSEVRIPFFWLQQPHNSTAVRLTHGFMKSKGRTAEGRTPRKHINKAKWVREVDLAP